MAHRIDPQLAFGRAVSQLRERERLSPERVASRGGFSDRWLRDVEKGRANPTLANIRRVASGLEVSLAELMQVTEELEQRY